MVRTAHPTKIHWHIQKYAQAIFSVKSLLFLFEQQSLRLTIQLTGRGRVRHTHHGAHGAPYENSLAHTKYAQAIFSVKSLLFLFEQQSLQLTIQLTGRGRVRHTHHGAHGAPYEKPSRTLHGGNSPYLLTGFTVQCEAE
jgi:hypothetical protein